MDLSTLLVVYSAGLLLLLAEIFIPSGGMLLVAAIGCVLFSVWGWFREGHPWYAGIALGFSVIYGYVLFHFAMRRLASPGDLRDATAEGRDVRRASAWIGREGTAVTPLRPSGVAEIDGERVDVVTEGRFVANGERVRVLATRGNRIVVQAI